jgi:hypothetical protein
MNKTVINFAAFQAGWFACVLGAANGIPAAGLLVAIGVVSLHLVQVQRPAPELALLGIALLLGLVFDSLMVSFGWIRYPNGQLLPGLAPYWILAMWAMFATTLNFSMKWMRGRLPLAILMGAVFGPLSYQAGARLGGLEFVDHTAAMIALGIGWASIMPLLVHLSRRLDGVSDATPALLDPLTQGEAP